MPRSITNAAIRHDTDAGYRAWVTEYEANLAIAGFVRTTDSGQIDATAIASMVRTINTLGGYSMWSFNDPLQSVAPIIFKVQYGSGGAVTTPTFFLTVGTATDGAGNFVGLNTGQLGFFSPNYTAATTNLRNSYFTHSNGFGGVVFKIIQQTGTPYTSPGNWQIQRTVDNTGAPTAEGCVITGANGQAGVTNTWFQARRFKFTIPTSAQPLDARDICAIPGSITSSLVGLNPQIFTHWSMFPKMTPLVGTATYLGAEIPVETIFSVQLVGAAPRQYLAAGWQHTYAAYFNAASGIYPCLAMLWED